MVSGKGYLEGSFTNELLIHQVLLEMRPSLKEAICKIANESKGSDWRERVFRYSDEKVKEQVEKYSNLNSCDFIKKQDDYTCFKILRTISYYQMLHNGFHKEGDGSRDGGKSKKYNIPVQNNPKLEYYSHINELSHSLIGVRGIYAHSKDEGCSY